MGRLLLSVAATVVARLRVPIFVGLLTAAVLAPSAAGLSAAKPSPLSTLRVCGNNHVPFTGSQCPRNESTVPLVASELDCSVRVAVSRPMTISAEFRYQGALQYSYTARVTRRAHARVIGNYFYDTKMPAGRYSCRFTLGGHHLGGSFRSGGPTGNLLGPSVCLGAHRVGIDECPSDESASPLPPSNSLTCDAVFARERGQTATIELLDHSGHVVQAQQDSLDHPITEAGATFTSGAGAFAPGAYDCHFLVAGNQADRQFSVSG